MAGKQGRPAWELTDERKDKALKWAKSGCTNQEIAKGLGIHRDTLQELLKRFPDFSDALKNAREAADNEVQNALFLKASTGDTIAAMFWLKARRGWRDNDADKLKAMALQLEKLKFEVSQQQTSPADDDLDAATGEAPPED